MINKFHSKINYLLDKHPNLIIFIVAGVLSSISTIYFFTQGQITAYGDSESHLNIAKRVVASPTPGFAQLGGIWLPLPHLLMTPFVSIDQLWRTGLAGSIVSGIAYAISSLFIYKLIYLLTKNKVASVFGFLVFALNANILYMQSTPMTEVLLIAFFILSMYFFIKFILNHNDNISLIAAAFFGFCATLTRYDGWLLVGIEALIILAIFVKNRFSVFYQGLFFLFSTLGFVGVLIWLAWDFLILGDALYFTNSPFSAKSQQQGWLARGELPTYHDIVQSFLYYSVTSLHNIGFLISILAVLSLIILILDKSIRQRIFIILLLFVPFIFYVLTLFMGQSVIFIPDLTPKSFEWNLFNVRYGIMMVPAAAILLGYLFSKRFLALKLFIVIVLFAQSLLFFSGIQKTITLEDGTVGLSSSKKVDAEKFLTKNYKDGYVLMDDYARSVSILRTTIPMQNVIYIGNKPYWEESLETPEKYAEWIVLQKDDTLWKNFMENKRKEERLYKYFKKTYTSNEILVFQRSDVEVSRGN